MTHTQPQVQEPLAYESLHFNSKKKQKTRNKKSELMLMRHATASV